MEINQYNLTKNFRFESAHRLDRGYKGKCKNLHGHSWNGNIEVMYQGNLDQFDMAVDYTDLGKFTKWVEQYLDHKTLVFAGDKELLQYLSNGGQEHVVFNANPTCEVIAKELYDRAVAHFINEGKHFVKVVSVTIHETCTTGCKFTKQPQNKLDKPS